MTTQANDDELDPKPYSGPNRRADIHLSDEQIEKIAEVAAEKAIEKMTSGVYQSIGKTVVERVFYIIGAIALGGYLWLKKEGII